MWSCSLRKDKDIHFVAIGWNYCCQLEFFVSLPVVLKSQQSSLDSQRKFCFVAEHLLILHLSSNYSDEGRDLNFYFLPDLLNYLLNVNDECESSSCLFQL